MARNLTAAQRVAIAADHVVRAHLVEIDADSGTLRFATTGHNLLVGGNTYAGAGALGSMKAIDESTELAAFGVEIELSGVPVSLVSLALSEPLQGRPLRIYTLFFDPGTNQPIGDPVLDWSGFCDVMHVIDGGQ